MVNRESPDLMQALRDEVEQRRVQVSEALDPKSRDKLGQFFTPSTVAGLLSSHASVSGQHVRLLDPGAGVGSLTASYVTRLLDESPAATVHAVTFEVDPALAQPLTETLNSLTRVSGGRFTYDQRSEDFLAWGVDQLPGTLSSPEDPEQFDLVLMNPPYRKINSNSDARRTLQRAGIETTNLYTAFLALAQRLLSPGGQLVAITPRSFFNGTYFRDFRRFFLGDLGLQAIHVFGARNKAFAGDAVLQENVIFAAVKGVRSDQVELTTSHGLDEDMIVVRHVPYVEVVRPDDPDFFIHVATDEGQAEIARRMQALPCTLSDLGIKVSTGRVVDFRARQWLRNEATETSVPLIYQAHIRAGRVDWPLPSFRKAQHIEVASDNASQFMGTGSYVLTKRFSAKEERRRVSAAVFDPEDLPGYDLIGFENHTNVFHESGAGLGDLDFARGLSVFLNSSLVDLYFRQFSGHTQVNCGDLRSLRYPTREQLTALGASSGSALPEQEKIDTLIEQHVPALAGDGTSPLSVQKKIEEALAVLRALDMPREQLNERSALSLLALLDLGPDDPWSAASAPLRGITPMMDFFSEKYGKTYKPNTRETVRRQTVHQFVDAGLLLYNPDKPDRPVNSPKAVYQVEQSALLLLQQFGQPGWSDALAAYRTQVTSLRARHAAEREMARIPVTLPDGTEVTLSPGGQNVLIKELVDGFCPRFVPGGHVLYVGDADAKWAVNEEESFTKLGLTFDKHGKMPDLVVYDPDRNWLLLIEAVTSHGPVNAKRHDELKKLFAGSTAGLVFVTSFMTRSAFSEYLTDISWETEVWCADSPSHLVHFNGSRFLGPYAD
ncbi:BsuBI/PstI family type II restriction endonuclease [Geodermatophilus sp. SYSU D01186]